MTYDYSVVLTCTIGPGTVPARKATEVANAPNNTTVRAKIQVNII